MVKKILAIVILVIALVQVVWGVYRAGSFVDFYAYDGAGQAFLDGVSPYGKEFENPVGTVNFIYPPGSLLGFGGIAWVSDLIGLSAVQTAQVFTCFSLLAFVVAIWFSFSLLQTPPPTWKKILIIALLVQTFPLKLTLTLGQINNFVLLLLVLGLYCFKKHKILVSSLLTAVAATIKLTPLGLLPWMVLKKQYKWSVLFVSFFVISNAVNFDLTIEYFTKELPRILFASHQTVDFYNQSLGITFLRLTHWEYSWLAGWLATFILCFFIFKRNLSLLNQQIILEQLLMLLPVLVLFPQNAWQHHLLLVYPFLLYFFSRSLVTFIPIWMVLTWHFDHTNQLLATFPWLASYQSLTLLLLLGFVLIRKKRICFYCVKKLANIK